MHWTSIGTSIVGIALAILALAPAACVRTENLAIPDSGTSRQSIFDPAQDIITIPDPHDNPEPYRWQARNNPQTYEFSLNPSDQGRYEITIEPPKGEKVEDIHLFITAHSLKFANHIVPDNVEPGRYSFDFLAPEKGKYRFETVFSAGEGWVNFRKDIELTRETKSLPRSDPGPEYEVKVRSHPKTVYTDHITTFVYEIHYKGMPVTDLQKMDGADMRLFTWSSSKLFSLQEFNYVVPVQSLGGPEVALSLVFKRKGTHVVFTEFSHMNRTMILRLEVEAFSEGM